MKLSKLFGIVSFFAGVIISSSVAFAADPVVSIGKPVDSSGNVVTEFKADTVVAVPLDISTPTNTISNFDMFLGYDSEYVTTSVTKAERNAFAALGEVKVSNGASFIACLYDADEEASGSFTGNGGYVGADTNPYDALSWNDVKDLDLNAGADLYFIVKITQDVTEDKLNVALFKDSPYNVVGWSASTQSKNDVESIDADQSKVNATQGAFKITLDASSLNYFVKEIFVNGVALTEYVEDSENVYSFPVRVNRSSKATEDLDITVTAEVYDDAAGTAGKKTVELASGTLTMDGSVNDYVQLSLK